MFSYTTGNVANINAWFVIFEPFAVTAGWTVVSGTGTQDMVLSSKGEDGKKTKLFMRVYKSGNNIMSDLRDDQPGTHKTTAQLVACGAGAFDYWMNIDKDMFSIAVKYGLNYDFMYAGCLLPFALRPTDETFYMYNGDSTSGRILRLYDGTWDQAISVVSEPAIRNYTNTLFTADAFILLGNWVGANENVAGELKNVCGRYSSVGVMVRLDTISTAYGEKNIDTTWILLYDNGSTTLYMRTGGGYPLGGDFEPKAVNTKMCRVYNPRDFFDNDLVPFLTSVGWTGTDNSGVSGIDRDYIFHSAGVTGLEDIYIRLYWDDASVNDPLHIGIRDDLAGTHTDDATLYYFINYRLPNNILIIATKEAVCLVRNLYEDRGITGGLTTAFFGMAYHFDPGLQAGNTSYKMVIVNQQDNAAPVVEALRRGDGTWNPPNHACDLNTQITGANNPNGYDGNTYMVMPAKVYFAGGVISTLGMLSLALQFASDGGGASSGDRVKVGNREYMNVKALWAAGGNSNTNCVRIK